MSYVLPEICRVRDITEHLHVARSTINRWRKEGAMPEPFVRGGHPKWHRDVIASWLRGK